MLLYIYCVICDRSRKSWVGCIASSLLSCQLLVDIARALAEEGVAYAPVTYGLCKESFYVRFLRRTIHSCHLKRYLKGRPVKLIPLQDAEGSKMGAALQTYVAHKGAIGCQAQPPGLVYGYLPADVPWYGVLVEALETGECPTVLYSVNVRLCHALKCLLPRTVVDKMLLPAVSPCAPSPTRHVRCEVEGWRISIRPRQT